MKITTKLPTEYLTVLQPKDKGSAYKLVRVDNSSSYPWLGDTGHEWSRWFTDEEVQAMWDTGEWEVA